MKIKKIETYVSTQQLEGKAFAYSQNWYNARTVLLLRMETDNGIVGWGESFGPAIVNKAIIDNIYAPLVIGMDPLNTQVIWDELYNKLRDHGQRGVTVEAISAIDIALWDIKGQAFDVPVYKLLGGSPRDKIMPYATGFYRAKDKEGISYLVKEAETYRNQGFKAMKVKVGFGIKEDAALIKAVRETVGDDVLLMMDANHAYNATNAIKLAKMVERYDIFWFEEPVPPEDLKGYQMVRANTTIPIAGGEASFSRYDFAELLSRECVDICQPDCGVIGGISEFNKIVTLATVYNTQVYPHIWGSGIALAVGMHCAFALPHFPLSLTPDTVLFEYDRTPNVFREELNKKKLVIEDGYIQRPVDCGLGLDIDEDLIRAYQVE